MSKTSESPNMCAQESGCVRVCKGACEVCMCMGECGVYKGACEVCVRVCKGGCEVCVSVCEGTHESVRVCEGICMRLCVSVRVCVCVCASKVGLQAPRNFTYCV